MKKSNIYFGQRNSMSVFVMLMLISITSIILSSCSKEDDIPPPSAYLPPVIDPTGGCTFLNVSPELSGDEAIDFECEGPEYTFFGEKDGTLTISYTANPALGGINASEKVVEVVQTAGIEPWAGFFFDLDAQVDFSVYQDIKLKVYSPAEGQLVNLKLEDSADGSISTETSTPTTVANEWEELCFSFSTNDSEKFDRFVLFFDFQGPKDAETVHYFDDIILGEGCMDGGDGGGSSNAVPSIAASTPSIAEDNVISLFSNAYTDVPIDTWLTVWSVGVLVDTIIEGDDIKKYSDLSFAGIETIANQIDITTMTNFRTDIWTADATEIKIKIVDFGADGAFDGGDDTEHEIVIDNPTQKEWISVDLQLADFTGLTTRANIAQFIYSAAPASQATIFMDNILFYDASSLLLEPAVAAPTPTLDAVSVISLFSDVYVNVPVDTWQTVWSQADFEEVDVMGNAVLKYSSLDFVGAEAVMNPIDVTAMTHFHLDIWTPDAAQFRLKIVDFGPDGGFDGGDDTEHELAFENPAQGEWISLDLPLSDFIGLTTKSNIAQLIFAGGPAGATTVFIDNVYFHN
ncbi:MAG: hypothetical protein ACI86M_001231 [Saprospiraceae bacterium]|jgi:hypothetical protein